MKEKPKYFKHLIFTALAASGKSEALTFLKKMPAEQRTDLHLSPEIVILDDFPYVDMMRHIDESLNKLGEPPVFFPSLTKCFLEPHLSWRLLILLLNEDCRKIRGQQEDAEIASLPCSCQPLKRFDEARKKLGAKTLFFNPDGNPLMGRTKYAALSNLIREKAGRLVEMRKAKIPLNPKKTTILLEFARGGEYGAEMPLPHAYADSFGALDPLILKDGAFLYLKVLPEQAAFKNFSRADPTDPSSILGHCVPYEVMFKDYGSDDFEYLRKTSKRPGFIKVKTLTHQEFFVLAAVLDNTNDLTTFVREHKDKDFAAWPVEPREKLSQALKQACDQLWKQYCHPLQPTQGRA